MSKQLKSTASQLLGAGLGLALGLSLVSCAADGGLAGKGKPLDFEQTRLATCEGAQKIDIAFQTIATAVPGKIPSKVMDAEGGFIYDVGFIAGNPAPARVGSLCAAVYAGDLNVAINTVIATVTNVSVLIQQWSAK